MPDNPQQPPLNKLIEEYHERGDYTGWFDVVYQQANKNQLMIPWAYKRPNPELIQWLDREQLDGEEKRALVVGCGLGDDAEALAKIGFQVTAFDIAPAAIQQCRQRFPHSNVDYRVMDLFYTPAGWRHGFDFVLESRTIQSLPWQLCYPSIRAIAQFVAPNGLLLVICLGRNPEDPRSDIPWALSRVELSEFEQHKLTLQQFEDDIDQGGRRRFRVSYRARDLDGFA